MKTHPKVWLRLLAAALAVIMLSGCWLFLQRNREGFSFTAQKGDASVLDRISVTGVLGDSFHSVAFASRAESFTDQTQKQVLFQKGRSNHHEVSSYYYEPLPGVEVTREQSVSSDASVENPDGSFSPLEQTVLLETADQLMLCLSKMSLGYYPYRVKTQVVYQKRLTIQYPLVNGEKDNIPHLLDLPAGSILNEATGANSRSLVQLGERWYAVTLTDAYCRGTGGIYDLTEQVGLPLWSENQPPITEQENLCPIDLQGGKNVVLGMEACGDKLAVFARVDGMLTMRIIDPQTWETRRIVALPGWENISMYESFHVKGDYAVLIGWQDQELEPGGVDESEWPEEIRQCDVIDLKEGAVVERMRDSLSELSAGGLARNIEDALYINDTLYLLSYFFARKPAGQDQRSQETVYHQQEWPCLIVYRGGRRVFECAIRSGQQEDERVIAPQIRSYRELTLQIGEGGD